MEESLWTFSFLHNFVGEESGQKYKQFWYTAGFNYWFNEHIAVGAVVGVADQKDKTSHSNHFKSCCSLYYKKHLGTRVLFNVPIFEQASVGSETMVTRIPGSWKGWTFLNLGYLRYVF